MKARKNQGIQLNGMLVDYFLRKITKKLFFVKLYLILKMEIIQKFVGIIYFPLHVPRMGIFSATKENYNDQSSPCVNSLGGRWLGHCFLVTLLWWSLCLGTSPPAPLHPAEMGFVMECGLCGGVWAGPVVVFGVALWWCLGRFMW